MTVNKTIEKLSLWLRRTILRRNNPYISETNNPLVVYRCYAGEIERLAPINIYSSSRSLSKHLFQDAGFVSIAGRIYDLNKDGVYRFYQLPKISEQRIVCNGGVDSLLKMIGYLFSYGSQDDDKNTKNLLNIILKRRVVAGCGVLASLVKEIFSKYKIESRLAYMMKLGDWGGQDDGHTVLEIKGADGGWFLYDPTFGYCFELNNKRISMYQFAYSIKNSKIVWNKLPSNLSYESVTRDKYEYDFWIGERFLSEDIMKNWFIQVAQLPILNQNGAMYCSQSFVNNIHQARVAKHFNIISDKEFLKRFYQ